jgi:hypothetical protein
MGATRPEPGRRFDRGDEGAGADGIRAQQQRDQGDAQCRQGGIGDVRHHRRLNADTEVARFILLKTNLAPDKLRVGKNGLVSEKGRIGDGLVLQPHQTGTVTLSLKPGKCVIVDNMPWTYSHGQYAAFTVTG